MLMAVITMTLAMLNHVVQCLTRIEFNAVLMCDVVGHMEGNKLQMTHYIDINSYLNSRHGIM
jgi:hypothetical protein